VSSHFWSSCASLFCWHSYPSYRYHPSSPTPRSSDLTTGDRTLSFSATALTPAVSGTITVGAGAATQLTLTTQPSATAQSGVAFAQQADAHERHGRGDAVSQLVV